MAEDFQRILEDNLCLKKSLQITRHQNDKLQQEISELRFNYQQLLDKNTEINHVYNQLQKKNQLHLAEHSKDISTLTSQIEDLKFLIDQKQQEMESFQIKMIPNLDQDMIRVKLITEMEGPYQQAVQKKEREITRLKEKLTQIERKYNISELQLHTKQKQFKRQLQETKNFYQTENQKILKELNIIVNKKEVKSYDKQVFKNQRKQLEELRCTLDLQSQNETDLRKQLMTVKIEKENLLVQISRLNEKKALDLHLSSQSVELRAIKQEKKRVEDELARKNSEIERVQKKMKHIEKQYKQNEEEMKRIFNKSKQKWENQKQDLEESLRKEREENHRSKNSKQRNEDDYQRLNQTFKVIERQLHLKKQECQKLKAVASELQRNNRELQFTLKKKLSLSKDIANDDLKQKKGEETHKKQVQKSQTYIKQLENTNARFKLKLQLANKKIVELLKEKVNKPKGQTNLNNSRDRAFSNIQLDQCKPQKDNAILLQYRDTSLTPLVPPTIFTHQRKH